MRVVVKREASWFDAFSLPFQGAAIAIGVVLSIFLFVPIVIAIEIKAKLARHRIAKEQAMGSWSN